MYEGKKERKQKKTKENKKKNKNKTRQSISDTGNRTPVSRVTGGDTSHYTMSESIQRSKFINYKKIEQNCPGRTATQGKKENNTRDSNVVPHRSTNRARQCLTSLSRREAVLSLWFGRSRHTPSFVTSYTHSPSKNTFFTALIEQLSIITLSTAFTTPNKVSDQLTTPRHPIWASQNRYFQQKPSYYQKLEYIWPSKALSYSILPQNLYSRTPSTSNQLVQRPEFPLNILPCIGIEPILLK